VLVQRRMTRRLALLAGLGLWTGCLNRTIDAEVHADGTAGHWDLYPAKCTADQDGTGSIEMPGGLAVPNVRIQQDRAGTAISVHGPPPSTPVVLHHEDCSTFEIDMHVDKHSGGRSDPPYYTVTGHVEFDCATPDVHVAMSATFEDCQ
jgi:hypothetical protein